MMVGYESKIKYTNSYEGLDRTTYSVPKIPKLRSHFLRRYEERFNEEFNGNIAATTEVFKSLINQECSEAEIFEMIDWFLGWILEPDIPSINLLKKCKLQFTKFREANKRDLRYNEDWFHYCRRIKKLIHEEPLDDIITRRCTEIPDRDLGVEN